MATFLRQIYEVLSCFSTSTHTAICNDLLSKLTKGKRSADNLAVFFSTALKENEVTDNIKQSFIPENRGNKTGRNPVASVLKKSSSLTVALSTETTYEFTFLHREVPHLRALTKKEQGDKAWIDYVARTKLTPILGEIKWKDDQNPFYAFIQLLTYLSEMATPNQIKRSVEHELFGKDIKAITAFDLHIFLANFNDRGEKGPLIDLTRELAFVFKERLQKDHPDTAKCLGNVLCFSGHIKDGTDCFSKIKCLWMV